MMVLSMRLRNWARDFPGGPMVKNLPCNATVVSLITGQGTTILRAAEEPNSVHN